MYLVSLGIGFLQLYAGRARRRRLPVEEYFTA